MKPPKGTVVGEYPLNDASRNKLLTAQAAMFNAAQRGASENTMDAMRTVYMVPAADGTLTAFAFVAYNEPLARRLEAAHGASGLCAICSFNRGAFEFACRGGSISGGGAPCGGGGYFPAAMPPDDDEGVTVRVPNPADGRSP